MEERTQQKHVKLSAGGAIWVAHAGQLNQRHNRLAYYSSLALMGFSAQSFATVLGSPLVGRAIQILLTIILSRGYRVCAQNHHRLFIASSCLANVNIASGRSSLSLRQAKCSVCCGFEPKSSLSLVPPIGCLMRLASSSWQRAQSNFRSSNKQEESAGIPGIRLNLPVLCGVINVERARTSKPGQNKIQMMINCSIVSSEFAPTLRGCCSLFSRLL